MRGSAWHYATHLLAPRSFHSAAGCNGGRQAAEGRSRGQVGVSVAPLPPGSRLPAPNRIAPTFSLICCFRPGSSDSSPIIHLPLPRPRPLSPAGGQVWFLATLHRLSVLMTLLPYLTSRFASPLPPLRSQLFRSHARPSAGTTPAVFLVTRGSPVLPRYQDPFWVSVLPALPAQPLAQRRP